MTDIYPGGLPAMVGWEGCPFGFDDCRPVPCADPSCEFVAHSHPVPLHHTDAAGFDVPAAAHEPLREDDPTEGHEPTEED